MPSPFTFTFPVPGPLDLGRTLGSLPMGASDPCWRRVDGGPWTWATRSPHGPLTLQLEAQGAPATGATRVRVSAWGEGAPWARTLAPAVAGLPDDPGGARIPHAGVRRLARRFAGFRLARSTRVADAAIAGACRRGVSGFEAARSWSLLVEALGDDAPGPGGLRLPPEPCRLAAAEPYDLHVLGLEQGRADEVRRIASHATRLELSPSEGPTAVIERLRGIAGLGADAIDHARAVALGDPDAIPVVDPHHRAALLRFLDHGDVPRPSDLDELLEPFRPHRGRVIRLVGLATDQDSGGL